MSEIIDLTRHAADMSKSTLLTQMYGRRALQEVSVNLADAVLHQCIRLRLERVVLRAIMNQRACVLISGQTSIGHLVTSVRTRSKTDPPFCLVLSQTSAGNC